MDRDPQKRLSWVKLYEETRYAGLVCRKCGISRPTLRKWWRRYKQQGIEGLKSQSKRPKNSHSKKVLVQQENWILELRRERKLGVRRIQIELERLQNYSPLLSTIQKVLQKHQLKPLRKIRRHKEIKDTNATFRVSEFRWILVILGLVSINMQPSMTALVTKWSRYIPG